MGEESDSIDKMKQVEIAFVLDESFFLQFEQFKL